VPPTDPNVTPEPDQDPTEGTQAEAAEDTTQDTQQGATIDWEARYKQEQLHISRQAEEIKRLKAQVAAPVESDEDEDEVEDLAEPAADAGSERLERDSWRLAEQEYGRDAISAYSKAARILDRASTPADFVGAFEAYYSARLEADTKRYAAEAKGQAPAQSEQAPIESNRSDASPRNDFDRQAEAAFAKGDSKGFLLAQIQKIRGS
jgi:hypothetical protein